MDKAGNHQMDIHHNIFLSRLSAEGTPVADASAQKEGYCAIKFFPNENIVVGSDNHEAEVKLEEIDVKCGNCYGAETPRHPCCETCEEVQDAYHRKGWTFNTPEKIHQVIQSLIV